MGRSAATASYVPEASDILAVRSVCKTNDFANRMATDIKDCLIDEVDSQQATARKCWIILFLCKFHLQVGSENAYKFSVVRTKITLNQGSKMFFTKNKGFFNFM